MNVPNALLCAVLVPSSFQEVRVDSLAARIDALAREAIEKEGVPGLSIAVGKDGDLLFAGGWGYADAGRGVRAAADTVYPIGSLTRQFTAVALLQLAEQGNLSLDDELSKWVPDFPAQGHRITLRQLLANTAGIPGYEDLAEVHGPLVDGASSREELFALFGEVPFEFTPGSRFCANNAGYLLLSMAVAKSSGLEYPEYVRERILQPLELERTRFLPLAERPAGFAQDCKHLSDERELEIPIAAGGCATSAQSLGSTVLDLFRWQCALDDRLLIDEESTTLMRGPARLASGEPTGHGFALAVDETSLGRVLAHSGGIGGFRAMLAYYPEHRVTVVVLANCDGAPVERLEREIARSTLGLLPGEIADLPLEAEELARLTGTWQIATQSARTFEKEGRLWLELAGQPAVRLLYQGHRVFLGADDPKLRITFQGDVDRPAISFELVREGLLSVGRRMGPSGP